MSTVSTIIYRTIVISAIAALLALLVHQYVTVRISEATAFIAQELAATEEEARRVVAATDSALSGATRSVLLRSCSRDEQDRFDALLRQLGTGLSNTELQFLAAYFDRCTGVFAREQALVIAELETVVGAMERWQVAYEQYDASDGAVVDLPAWHNLLDALRAVSVAEMNLVDAQRELVLARLDGAPVAGPRITATMDEVATIRAEISEHQEAQAEAAAVLEL